MSDALSPGSPAPDFTLPTDSGETVTLSTLKGKPVVVYFYPKVDTSGCTAEALDFTALKDEFAALGATVIAISPDSVKAACKFRDKHGLGVTLAADETRAAIDAYGVWAEKSMYGRKYMGVDRSTFLIDGDGRLARAWRGVKVPNHATEVLEAVRALA